MDSPPPPPDDAATAPKRTLPWGRKTLTAVALTVVALLTLLAAPGISRAKGSPPGATGTAADDPSDSCPWLDRKLQSPPGSTSFLHAMTPLRRPPSCTSSSQPPVPYEGFTPAMPSLCIPMITEQDGAAGVASGS